MPNESWLWYGIFLLFSSFLLFFFFSFFLSSFFFSGKTTSFIVGYIIDGERFLYGSTSIVSGSIDRTDRGSCHIDDCRVGLWKDHPAGDLHALWAGGGRLHLLVRVDPDRAAVAPGLSYYH